MANKPVIHEGASGTVVIYQDDAEKIRVQAVLHDETLWMPQAMMAELFDVKPQAITRHLGNIYAEGELDEAATCSKI